METQSTYNLQRTDEFQPGDVGEVGEYHYSACIPDHQHIRQLSYRPSLPGS